MLSLHQSRFLLAKEALQCDDKNFKHQHVTSNENRSVENRSGEGNINQGVQSGGPQTKRNDRISINNANYIKNQEYIVIFSESMPVQLLH